MSGSPVAAGPWTVSVSAEFRAGNRNVSRYFRQKGIQDEEISAHKILG